MASPVLHIKDSYYFEVPNFMWRSSRESMEEFPDWWVRLDPEFQLWEAERLHEALVEIFGPEVPPREELIHDFEQWQHADHANFGKPFDAFLLATQPWFSEHADANGKLNDESLNQTWQQAKQAASDVAAFDRGHDWSAETIEHYNRALDGRILIPQPFGPTLRNAYEVESGFAISKYMVIELVVALLVVAMFSWLALKVRQSNLPRGRMWNFLEVILLYFRDHVARPAIDRHEHGHDEHGNCEPHQQGDEEVHLGDAHLAEEIQEAARLPHQHVEHEGDRYVPLLWTFFTFILGCNLFGLLPWAGSPTAAFGCTLGLAAVTFLTGVACGMLRFGVFGFFGNQVPPMDLPFGMGYVLKPGILLIEMLGMAIKHGVLGVRLLANMVAGHLVILGIMGAVFSLEAATALSTGVWSIGAIVAILGATAFYGLELFVAFLQAYIFTFLSALFIGSAIHKH